MLAVVLAGAASASEPFLEKIDLFQADTGGYALYRIPGIVVTSRGAVLAYAEARKNDRGDWGAIDLVLRRSEDQGRSWSPMRKIGAVPGPHRKNPAALALKGVNPDDVTYNNPAAIVDRKGVVHFLFCLEYMRAFYMRSEDGGRTFSNPVEITSAFEQFRPEYDWKVLATGPGHGIELRNGRLVMPVWLSTGTGGGAHRPSVVSVIYSNDRGKTWRRGDIAVPNTSDFVNPSETAAVQLSDGRVMLNVRNESKQHRRIVVTSNDGATKWSAPGFVPDLLEPICMASMIRLSLARREGRNRLLFSNPDNLERAAGKAEPGRNRDRKNLTVKLSYDEGETWPASRVLEAGVAGYSDLAVAREGTILCFYERGGKDQDHFKTAFLTLARFNLEWLSYGKDSLSRRR